MKGFYDALSDRGPIEARLVESLSQDLIGGIDGWAPIERVVVVADSELHYVLFAALSDPESRNGEPLVANRTIAYLPSAGSLIRLGDRTCEGQRIAVIADPIFSRGDPRVAKRTVDGKVRSVTAIVNCRGRRMFNLLGCQALWKSLEQSRR